MGASKTYDKAIQILDSIGHTLTATQARELREEVLRNFGILRACTADGVSGVSFFNVLKKTRPFKGSTKATWDEFNTLIAAAWVLAIAFEKPVKPVKPEAKQPHRLVIRYWVKRHVWVIEGTPVHQGYFATKMKAEEHCIDVLHSAPAISGTPQRHQELPEKSVWTGAPWDHSFKNIDK